MSKFNYGDRVEVIDSGEIGIVEDVNETSLQGDDQIVDSVVEYFVKLRLPGNYRSLGSGN